LESLDLPFLRFVSLLQEEDQSLGRSFELRDLARKYGAMVPFAEDLKGRQVIVRDGEVMEFVPHRGNPDFEWPHGNVDVDYERRRLFPIGKAIAALAKRDLVDALTVALQDELRLRHCEVRLLAFFGVM
jgi:hypothetical protein